MVLSTVLGKGEVEDFDDLLFADGDANMNPYVEVRKHFESRVGLIGCWVCSIIDFDTSEEGKAQLRMYIRGSELAREKGLGQIVSDAVEPGHSFYNSEFFTVVTDADSYTPEKLLQIGYTATGLIPDGYSLEFVPVLSEPIAQVMPLQSRSQRAAETRMPTSWTG